MSTAENGTPSRQKFAAVFILLGLPVLLCGGALSWWFGRQGAAFQTLIEKRDSLLARGLPIDDETLTEFRYRHMNRDHSDRWVKVLDQISSQEFRDSCSTIPIIGAPDDEEPFIPGKPYKHEKEVRKFLERWRPMLVELHEIAEGAADSETTGAIWTPIEFNSFQTLLPGIQSCREVARLLDLEYEDAVRRDDRDQAFHSLMAMIGVARSLEKEPILVSQLVHVAIASITVRKIKQSIELDLLTQSQLQDLLEQLKRFDDFGSKYRLAIAGERALSQPLFDNPSQIGDESISLSAGARPIDALAALDFWERAESIESENLSDFAKETQDFLEQFRQGLTQASWLRRFDTRLTEMTTPALDAYASAVVRSALETRLAKIAIGLRLFEKQNGRFPISLDELTSKEFGLMLGPIETASDRPFGLRLQDGMAEIWGSQPNDFTHAIPDRPVDVLSLSEDERDILELSQWKLTPAN